MKRKNIDKWLRATIRQLIVQYQFEYKEKPKVSDWLDICEARDKEYIEKNMKMYTLQTLFSIKFDRWIGMLDLSYALADYLSNKKDILLFSYYENGKEKYLKYRCKWKDWSKIRMKDTQF